MTELLPIGRFGRESQLSPRQLRYYHALGLLVPALINPDSGYRYYASAQLATAELIALLRTADMPVADIQALLADRSQANVRAIFERLRAGVEEKLKRARAILDHIHELEDAAMPSDHQATYAFTAFTPDAQQALERAQALAEESHHSTIAVAPLMASVADEFESDSKAILALAGRPVQGPGQPMPAPQLRTAIAAAFEAAGVEAPGADHAIVTNRHLAAGCLRTSDGQAIAERLGLNLVV